MRRIFVLLAVVLLSVSAHALSLIETQQQPADPRVAMDKLVLPTGEFELVWNPDYEWFAQGAGAKVTDKPDSRITKLPKFASEKPWFVVFRLDSTGPDGLVAAALDESGGTGKGYDRAYIDCNRNWDLSDETPCYVRHQSSHDWNNWNWDFSLSDLNIRNSDWVKISPVKDQSTGKDIFISLTPYDLDKDNSRSCFVTRRGGWSAKLSTNLGEVAFRVTDSNCDGIYCSASSGDGTRGDSIQINNILIPDRKPTDVELELYPVLWMGRRFVSVWASGSKLSIRPYAGAFGKLRVVASGVCGRGCGVRELVLTGSVTGRLNSLEIGSQSIELPVGSYKFESCSLNVSHPGAKIQVDCRFDGDCTRVVSEGKPAVLVLGGNVSTALNPQDTSLIFKTGQYNVFQRAIKLGNSLSVSSIRTDMAAPAVQLLDFTGRVVHKAASEFT